MKAIVKRIKYKGKEYFRLSSKDMVTRDFTPTESFNAQMRAKKHKAKTKLEILPT